MMQISAEQLHLTVTGVRCLALLLNNHKSQTKPLVVLAFVLLLILSLRVLNEYEHRVSVNAYQPEPQLTTVHTHANGNEEADQADTFDDDRYRSDDVTHIHYAPKMTPSTMCQTSNARHQRATVLYGQASYSELRHRGRRKAVKLNEQRALHLCTTTTDTHRALQGWQCTRLGWVNRDEVFLRWAAMVLDVLQVPFVWIAVDATFPHVWLGGYSLCKWRHAKIPSGLHKRSKPVMRLCV